MTWLLCHPDLSGLCIYDLVLGAPIGPGSTLRDGEDYRLRLGRRLALGLTDCSMPIGHAGAQLGPAAVQSVEYVSDGRMARLRLGRLLAFGTVDCPKAIGRTSA